MVCNTCGVDKPRVRTDKKYGTKAVFSDNYGNLWHRRKCPACFKEYKIMRSRVTGTHRERNSQTRPEHAKAYENEMLVFNFLKQERKHQIVRLGTGKGPDIIAIDPDGMTLYEVKTVSVDAQTGAKYVNPVTAANKPCDIVALVYPDGVIMFDDMKTHLALCGKSGSRGDL